MKKLAFGALVCILVLLSINLVGTKGKASQKDICQKMLSNTCLVLNGDLRPLGSGVLLDEGIVLTAKHVVEDGPLREIGREFNLEFFDSVGTVCSATVIFTSTDFDYVILVPEPSMIGISSVILERRALEFGERVYAIGCPLGGGALLTEGYLGIEDDQDGKASCAITFGNSGGPIFDSEGRLLGIASRMGRVQRHESTRVFDPDGNEYYGSTMVNFPIQTVMWFVKANDIYTELRANRLIYIPPYESDADIILWLLYTAMVGNLLFIGGWVWKLRK